MKEYKLSNMTEEQKNFLANGVKSYGLSKAVRDFNEKYGNSEEEVKTITNISARKLLRSKGLYPKPAGNLIQTRNKDISPEIKEYRSSN
jgi:hypothetical protein